MQASTLRSGRPDGLVDSVPTQNYRSAVSPIEHPPFGELSNMDDSNARDNAVTDEEKRPTENEIRQESQTNGAKSRLTIKQLREAAQEAAQNNATENSVQKQQQPALSTVPAPQKKKPSIFGGLFQVKEPTQIALNQVAAQIIAQHGSTSATKVPNVRLEKMPDHVPKVNSKWDGIPDSVKQKERKDKERAKASKKDPSLFSNPRSSSSGTRYSDGRRLDSRNSSSTTGSFGSRGRSSGSHSNSAQTKFYAQSVNSSGDLASQQRTDRPRPHTSSTHSHSASAASLPESVVESIPEIPQYLREAITRTGPIADPKWRRGSDTTGGRPAVKAKASVEQPPKPRFEPAPSIEDVPQHSTSPLPSPQDTFPATPFSLHPGVEPVLASKSPGRDQISSPLANPVVISPPVVSKKKPPRIITPAFLAGEAQELVLPDDEKGDPRTDLPLRNWTSGQRIVASSPPPTPRVQQDLEKRPDSSRARLGLRASILLRDDQTPWDMAEQEAPALPSSQTPRTPNSPTSPHTLSSPRTKFPKGFNLFSKEKDKS